MLQKLNYRKHPSPLKSVVHLRTSDMKRTITFEENLGPSSFPHSGLVKNKRQWKGVLFFLSLYRFSNRGNRRFSNVVKIPWGICWKLFDLNLHPSYENRILNAWVNSEASVHYLDSVQITMFPSFKMYLRSYTPNDFHRKRCYLRLKENNVYLRDNVRLVGIFRWSRRLRHWWILYQIF